MDSALKAQRRKAYHARKTSGVLCAQCSKPWAGSTVLCEDCKRLRRGRTDRLSVVYLKRDALAAYGGPICKCCGESNPIFLTLDHINNDGGKHRKELFGTNLSGGGFYQKLKKAGWPNDRPLQVLCYNCNNGKRANKGVCPHQSGKGI